MAVLFSNCKILLTTFALSLVFLTATPGSLAQAAKQSPPDGNGLPDIPSLLAQVRDHQDALDKLRENYTYTQTVTTKELDKNGKEIRTKAKTYNVTFYQHREIQRLTAVDGKALAPDAASKEDRRTEKLIKELETGKSPPDPEANRQMRIATLLRAERFGNPRRERFRERDVIVFEFEPDPAFRPANGYETFYQKMAGTMWVDAADLQVARLEFSLINDYKVAAGMFFNMKKGAHFVNEQDRFFGQIWLPTLSNVRFGARAMMFYGFGIDESTSFGNYRRFNISTEEKTAPTPQKPPQ